MRVILWSTIRLTIRYAFTSASSWASIALILASNGSRGTPGM